MDSKNYVVLTTHKGLYRVNPLAFGLACTPTIFKSVIKQIIATITYTQPYIDDIVITVASAEKHLENLYQCLSMMRAAGISLQQEKCHFFKDEILHLGHVLDRHGVGVNNKKNQRDPCNC